MMFQQTPMPDEAFEEFLKQRGMWHEFEKFRKDRSEKDRGVAELDVLRDPNRWYTPYSNMGSR